MGSLIYSASNTIIGRLVRMSLMLRMLGTFTSRTATRTTTLSPMSTTLGVYATENIDPLKCGGIKIGIKQMKTIITLLLLTALSWASDTVTIGSLQWQDNAEAKSTKLNWDDAKSYCQELDLASHNDWRLPTIKELQSIADVSRYNPAIKRDFKHVASSFYWSSSQTVSAAKDAWDVYFEYGHTSYYAKSDEYYVRCVRHRQ